MPSGGLDGLRCLDARVYGPAQSGTSRAENSAVSAIPVRRPQEAPQAVVHSPVTSEAVGGILCWRVTSTSHVARFYFSPVWPIYPALVRQSMDDVSSPGTAWCRDHQLVITCPGGAGGSSGTRRAVVRQCCAPPRPSGAGQSRSERLVLSEWCAGDSGDLSGV